MGRRTMVEKIIVPQEVEAQQSPEVKAQQVQYTPMHALAQRLGGTEIRVPDLTCKLKATTTTTADRKATFTPKGRKAEKFY